MVVGSEFERKATEMESELRIFTESRKSIKINLENDFLEEISKEISEKQ